MRMSFRRELITLILLLGKEKLNIYKFNKQIRRNEQNTKNIQNDLKQILKTYNIKHLEYIKTANIEKLFKNNENIETKFVRIKENTESSDESIQDKKTRYKCFYCEKVILEDEIQIQ